MAGTNYKINPVRATCMKYGENPPGIQGVNDTCFGICTAFSGSNNVYQIDPHCAKSCEDYIEKVKHKIYGVGSCDHQAPYRPVVWNQVPRYFPKLLKKMDPNRAKMACIDLCRKNGNIVAECIQHCEVDFNAVEPYETVARPNRESDKSDTESVRESDRGSKWSEKDIAILVGVIIFFIIVGVVFWMV